jgi:hypothetical protein
LFGAHQRRPFEIIDDFFKKDKAITAKKASFDHKMKIERLNADVGKYKSANTKINWAKEDPLLHEVALKRLENIQERVLYDYKRN